MNGNNILNNCKININNINYNNYNNSNNNNNNTNINYNNYNHIFNEKMNYLNNKKNSIEIQNNNKVQNNKISSQSQQELTQIKKNKNKNFTTNNSPINKNINIKNRISINNSQNSIKTNNNINSYSSKNSKKNNNNNNSIKAKETKKIKYEIKQKPKTKTNNNSLLFENKIYEILELKHNLQKNNSEIYISAEKNEKKSKDFSKNNEKNDKDKESINNNYNNKNTISNLSSTTHDSNYYMEKCNSLSKYIRDYYRRYNKYPNTNLNFYLYGRLIGQGAFGKVNIGLNILSGRVVAIKSFNKKSLSTNGDNMKKILSETDLMKKLNHPNVTKILEMFEDDGYILIAMEYINGGNLFSFVKKRRKLSEKTAKFLFRQIILGIKQIAHIIIFYWSLEKF